MTLARFRRWLRSDVGEVVTIVPIANPDRSAPAIGLAAGLRGWRRRILRARAVVLVSRQLVLALGIAIVLELLGALTGAGSRAVWLALPAALATLGVLAGLRQRPQPRDTALLLDRQLGLAERLTTALELGSAAAAMGPLGTVLRSEADLAIGASLAGARARARFSRNELLAILASVALLAVLLVLPDHSHAGQTRSIGGPEGVQSAGGRTGGKAGKGVSGSQHVPARRGSAIRTRTRTQAAAQTQTTHVRPAAGAHGGPGAGHPTSTQGAPSTAQPGKGEADLHGSQASARGAQAGIGSAAKRSGQRASAGAAAGGAQHHASTGSGPRSAHGGRNGSGSAATSSTLPSSGSQRSASARHAASSGAGRPPGGRASSGHPGQGALRSPHSSSGAAPRGAAGSPAAKTGAGAARGARPSSQSTIPTAARGGTATLPIQAGWAAGHGQRGSTAPAGAHAGGGGGRGQAQGISSAAASTRASFPFIPLLADEVPGSELDLLLGYFGASSGLTW